VLDIHEDDTAEFLGEANVMGFQDKLEEFMQDAAYGASTARTEKAMLIGDLARSIHSQFFAEDSEEEAARDDGGGGAYADDAHDFDDST
jgi:hypothetical protein